MSNKTETKVPLTEEEVDEWMKELEKLEELDDKLRQNKSAKELGLPYHTLNEEG